VSLEESRRLVRRKIALWYEPDRVDELRTLVAVDYVHHTPHGDLDFGAFAEQLGYLAATFTEPKVDVLHVVVEGDLAAAYIGYEATHSGPFGGVEPTGCRVSTTGAYHCRIAGGAVAEDWDAWGLLGILRQVEAAARSSA